MMKRNRWYLIVLILPILNFHCEDSTKENASYPPLQTGGETQVPQPICEASQTGGTQTVSQPELKATLSDRWHEAWLGSPTVADLDNDGQNEIIVTPGNLVIGWHLDNTIVFRTQTDGGRIWASPVVADILPLEDGLEIAVADI